MVVSSVTPLMVGAVAAYQPGLAFMRLLIAAKRTSSSSLLGWSRKRRVAVLGAHAEVDQHGGVAAVVEDHVRRAAVRPFEDLVGVVPVILEALALDGEHRRAGGGDGGGGVVLGRVDVARGPADVGAERLQGLDQHGGLDGHVQRAGDARALQRLRRRRIRRGSP